MPYLRRDPSDGEVTGVSRWPSGEHQEKVADDHPDLVEYLQEKPRPKPAVIDPMARLMIRKGLVTAKEVNDEFALP